MIKYADLYTYLYVCITNVHECLYHTHIHIYIYIYMYFVLVICMHHCDFWSIPFSYRFCSFVSFLLVGTAIGPRGRGAARGIRALGVDHPQKGSRGTGRAGCNRYIFFHMCIYVIFIICIYYYMCMYVYIILIISIHKRMCTDYAKVEQI